MKQSLKVTSIPINEIALFRFPRKIFLERKLTLRFQELFGQAYPKIFINFQESSLVVSLQLVILKFYLKNSVFLGKLRNIPVQFQDTSIRLFYLSFFSILSSISHFIFPLTSRFVLQKLFSRKCQVERKFYGKQ